MTCSLHSLRVCKWFCVVILVCISLVQHWSSFHTLICYLCIVFCDVSVEICCPFASGLSVCVWLRSERFCLCSLITNVFLISHAFCRHFPLVSSPPHLSNGIIERKSVFSHEVRCIYASSCFWRHASSPNSPGLLTVQTDTLRACWASRSSCIGLQFWLSFAPGTPSCLLNSGHFRLLFGFYSVSCSRKSL